MGEEARIWYVCPDGTRPTGGIRVIYRHVDLLNAAGQPAAVVHDQPGFRCSWFSNTTRVTSREEAEIDPARDILVWPESQVRYIEGWQTKCRRVIFNQGTYLTFEGWALNEIGATAYRDPRTLGIMTGSNHGQRCLREWFPGVPVHRVTVGIDTDVFRMEQHAKRLPQICYMPRRNPEDAQTVLCALGARGALQGIEVVPIDGCTPEQVADRLRSAQVFLSLGDREGFGLPPAEAMACGCIVVGYHGYGGAEYLHRGVAYPVPAGDLLTYVRSVERVLRRWRSDAASMTRLGRRASEFVRRRYSLDRERESVLKVWGILLGNERPSPARRAVRRVRRLTGLAV